MPYEAEEDSNPEEDQNQLEMTPDQIEIDEAPAKKGMEIAVGPGEYQPVPPRYIRADKDNEDDKDTDEEEDIEAPYLAPKQNPTLKTLQDEQTAPALQKGKIASDIDSQVSSDNESIPEFIDLREEEEVSPPSPPKNANCPPLMLGLHEKTAVTTDKLPVLPFPPPKENGGPPANATTNGPHPHCTEGPCHPKEDINPSRCQRREDIPQALLGRTKKDEKGNP